MSPERANPRIIDLEQSTLRKSEEILKRVLEARSPFKELQIILPNIDIYYTDDELVRLKREGDISSLMVACFPTLFHSIRRHIGLGITADELFNIGLEEMLRIINSWNPGNEQIEKHDNHLRFIIHRRLNYLLRREIVQRHGMKNEHDGYQLILFYHDSLRRFKQEFGRLPSQEEIIAFMEERLISGEALDVMGDTKIGNFFRDEEMVAKISDFYNRTNCFPTVDDLGLNKHGLTQSFRENIQVIDRSVISYSIEGSIAVKDKGIEAAFIKLEIEMEQLKKLLKEILESDEELPYLPKRLKELRARIYKREGDLSELSSEQISEIIRRAEFEERLRLTLKEARLLYLFLFLSTKDGRPITLKNIADNLGISPNRVSQIIGYALIKLKPKFPLVVEALRGSRFL